MNTKELQACCETLAAKYPQAGLTFGYLGNVGHDRCGYYDNRQWYFFTQVEKNGRRAAYDLGANPEQATVRVFPNGTVCDGSRQLSKQEFTSLQDRPLEAFDVEAWLVRLLT